MPIKINKVATRRGDKGISALIGDEAYPKTGLRLKALVENEELQYRLGKVILHVQREESDTQLVKELEWLQSTLFQLGTSIACATEEAFNQWNSMDQKVIQKLEAKLESYNKDMPELQGFILPGSDETELLFHSVRVQSRKLELLLWDIQAGGSTRDTILCVFLNRLSDLFFSQLRFIMVKNKKSFNLWQPIKEI